MQPKFTLKRFGIYLKLIPVFVLFCFSVSKTNAQCSWSTSVNYPINVLDNGIASVGTNLYSFAGVSNGAVIANAYRFDGTTWTALAPVPAPKEFPGVASDGTNVFIMGGYDGAGLTNSMYRYNVATNNYTLMAPMPVTAWALTAVYFNGKIYRFGGQIDLFGTTTNALHIYDIATNTWSTGATVPYAASFIGGFELGGFIYAVGGNTGAATNKTYRYDPVANTWNDAAIADLPAPRWGAATANYGGFGVMAGGYDATAPQTSAIIWDPVGNAWSSLPNMTTERARFNGGVISGNFYAVGGRCNTAGCNGFQGTNTNQRLACNFTPCSGTPNPGNTVSTANPVCPTVPFTLSLQNTQGVGTTYQWQTASSSTGPWTNVSPGGTGSTLTTNISTATWFRAVVTCTNSGQTTNSNPLQVTMNPPTSCYCAAGATSTAFEKISRVQFKTIDNPSTSTAGYEDFTAISTNVVAGETAPMTVTISQPFSTDEVIVWVDLNINGSFNDPGERLWTSPRGVGPHTGNITIPASASSGSTRMRIRMHDAAFGGNSNPCGNSTYGQVEDYTLNISPCIQGVFTTQPQNTTAQCSGNATITAAATGSVLSYQWEYRVNASSPWLLVNNGGTAPVISGATTNQLTLSNIPSTWTGYQFRVIMSGPCTAPDFSNVATLTVGPLVAQTNITSANICNGQIVQLRLTNVPATTTTTFNSGAISVPIPDNNPAGASHTMPVTIPANSQITGVAVTFSIPAHTWPGDLVVVVRDPLGNILNLDYYISATGAGPGSGMLDTKISSAGGPLLSSVGPGTRYTGTFRADARTTAAAGFGPPSPTGFTGTLVGTWTPLMQWSGGTGNWTIAAYDGFGLDVGSLTNWQLELTYGSPATGVWTANPATPNTMFTDPAATVPYVAGSQANTIYVKPSVNTTYCVTYATSNPPCTSAPTCIPVNVFNPITNLQVTPASPRLCVGDDITLSASAGGGPATWQWEVSTNGGLTWTTITGATGSTLTLNDVTASMNNNRYRVTASASACGSTSTSAVQILKVDLAPVVTISSPTLQLLPGRTTTITASSDTTVPANNFTWFFNGTQLTSTTNSVTADINGLGNYQVTVVDKNGCVGTSNVLVIGGERSERLWIYPNPTTDGRFQVRLYYDGVQMERRKVVIYTATGQKVAEKWFDLNRSSSAFMEMSFDLRHLPNGTYVVKVNEQYMLADDDNVKNVASGLLLIQR